MSVLFLVKTLVSKIFASNLNMTLDMTRLEDLSQILPHPPLLTSKQVDWKNIFLAYYQHLGSETGEHVMQQQALEVIDTNSWSHHERPMDGSRRATPQTTVFSLAL